MRFQWLLAVALPLWAAVSPFSIDPMPTTAADVAVAPFQVERDSAGILRATADTCLERLVRTLTAKGVTVALKAGLTEKTLSTASPAPLAVLGHFGLEKGVIQAELRLMDVESGDELRSYMNSDKNPDLIGNLGVAAGERIALVVQERKNKP